MKFWCDKMPAPSTHGERAGPWDKDPRRTEQGKHE